VENRGPGWVLFAGIMSLVIYALAAYGGEPESA
jgi:hypothetical protein